MKKSHFHLDFVLPATTARHLFYEEWEVEIEIKKATTAQFVFLSGNVTSVPAGKSTGGSCFDCMAGHIPDGGSDGNVDRVGYQPVQ